MTTGKIVLRTFIVLVVVVLQLIMTQVVTLLVSLLLSGMGDFIGTNPVLFVLVLGVTFSIGVFLAGWLALKLGWLYGEPRYTRRFAGALIGAYLALLLALLIYHPIEPGNPFFLYSALLSILGFHLAGWVTRK